MPRWAMRYAITIVADLLTPAWQCTNTRPPVRCASSTIQNISCEIFFSLTSDEHSKKCNAHSLVKWLKILISFNLCHLIFFICDCLPTKARASLKYCLMSCTKLSVAARRLVTNPRCSHRKGMLEVTLRT
jgi:hypothetical protein